MTPESAERLAAWCRAVANGEHPPLPGDPDHWRTIKKKLRIKGYGQFRGQRLMFDAVSPRDDAITVFAFFDLVLAATPAEGDDYESRLQRSGHALACGTLRGLCGRLADTWDRDPVGFELATDIANYGMSLQELLASLRLAPELKPWTSGVKSKKASDNGSRDRRRAGDKTRARVVAAFKRLRTDHPETSRRKICEKVAEETGLSLSTVQEYAPREGRKRKVKNSLSDIP